MSTDQKSSRVNKYEKRRKNTKLLSIMAVICAILIVLFIGTFIFGGHNDKTSPHSADSDQERSTQSSDETDQGTNETNEDDEEADSKQSEDDKEDHDEDSQDVTKEKVESSDENVKEAHKADWQPVGTDQTGEHTVNYDDNSKDRKEMIKAVSVSTGLSEDNMTTWWIGRNGDQQVKVTVSDKDNTKTYRVYLKWIDDEGWQPTKVEELKENDVKQKANSN